MMTKPDRGRYRYVATLLDAVDYEVADSISVTAADKDDAVRRAWREFRARNRFAAGPYAVKVSRVR
jgi:hypothetical protein